MQFGAAVAAHGEQGETVVVLEPVLPDLCEERVYVARPFGNKVVHIATGPELTCEFGVRLGDAAAQVGRVRQRASPPGCRGRVTEPGVGRASVVCRGRASRSVLTQRQEKSSSPRRVNTSTPSTVTRHVCSHWAESLWSLVTTVHWSGRIFT